VQPQWAGEMARAYLTSSTRGSSMGLGKVVSYARPDYLKG